MRERHKIVFCTMRTLFLLFLWGLIFNLFHELRMKNGVKSTISFVSLTIPFTLNAFHLIAAILLLLTTTESNTCSETHFKRCQYWGIIANISYAMIFLEIIGLYCSGLLELFLFGAYGIQCFVRVYTVQKIKDYFRNMKGNPSQIMQIDELSDGASHPWNVFDSARSHWLSAPTYPFSETEVELMVLPKLIHSSQETPPPIYEDAIKSTSKFPPPCETMLELNPCSVQEYINHSIPKVHSSSTS